MKSIFNPNFNNRVVDRILVTAESAHINPIIIINKIDLDEEFANDWLEFYKSVGYKVILTSVNDNFGLEEVRKELQNKTNLFWGPSGVGKSSILNSLYPDLDLTIGEISDASNKGKHTTVTSLMNFITDQTIVIDTPGIREIDPYGIKKEDLHHYFIEFEEHSHNCKFNTCIHEHEPGCKVLEAVENGIIKIDRYESYLNILNTIEDDMLF